MDLPMTLRELAIEQLDRATAPLRSTSRSIPKTGWVRAIRTAIGMTSAQLGHRLGVTMQSLLESEKREATGDITLTQLRKIGEALNCDLYYVLVPRAPLSDMVKDRARQLATRDAEELAHSMALEDQQTDRALKERQIESAVQRLLSGRRWSELWR